VTHLPIPTLQPPSVLHLAAAADQDLHYASALPPALRHAASAQPPHHTLSPCSLPLLLLLPRAVAVESEQSHDSGHGRAGVVTWTNGGTAGAALNLRDGLVVDEAFLRCSSSSSSSRDSVVSFNRRSLPRLPPDMASLSASLVIFSCSANSLQRLDFGGKGLPNLKQLDCRCVVNFSAQHR
jgi:hypothetical protein